MTDVKSKNLYELLGNDHDQDSDKEPEPPTKAVDKSAPRVGKRDGTTTKEADAAPRNNNNNRDSDRRRGGFTGSERAFRDRTAGRNQNRDLGPEGEAGVVKGRDSGPGTQRRGRGNGPRRGGDRHSRTGRGDHAKQVEGGWGRATGEGEDADEKAGQAIAEQEIKEDGFDANAAAPAAEPAADAEPEEPENNNKSYADYLAEQAQKKLADLGLKEARAANEGSKENKKWKSAKELSREGEEENYFIGEAKARRERERAAKKEYVDLDYSFKEPPRESGGRGGRGGRGRGGEGRGRGRGDRGDRGEYRGRGDRAERGDRPRGGRGRSDAAPVAVSDESAFPALGK